MKPYDAADCNEALFARQSSESDICLPHRYGSILRAKLYKLAWDLVGSEFAGRHMLYEKFYAGNSIVVRNQSDREAPWARFHGLVDRLLESIPTPTDRDLQ